MFFELDDITKKIELVVRDGIIAIRLDEKSLFRTVLGLNHGWDYKHYNEYISQTIINLSSTKISKKCDVIDGCILDGSRQPILFSFVLDKPPGYKIFYNPEIVPFKKQNKSVWNTTTFYLGDDNHEKVKFNGETVTFALSMIKILFF